MRRLKRFYTLLWGLLKELSGESAYARHLAAHGREHTPEEWRRFQAEWGRRRFQNPRCC